MAAVCSRNLALTIPVLVDDMRNSADLLYRGWPERIYLISADGRVSYQGGKGPYGFNPDELDAFLEETL